MYKRGEVMTLSLCTQCNNTYEKSLFLSLRPVVTSAGLNVFHLCDVCAAGSGLGREC